MDECAFNQSSWIFGYGSIIWKTAFPYAEKVPGYVEGYARRFWQGSHDHRGTLKRPGRVVTLVESSDEVTWGVAYRIDKDVWPFVVNNLNTREIDGYSAILTKFIPRNDTKTLFYPLGEKPFDVWIYVALENNESFLGDAPIEYMAQQILESEGPSGSNAEYLLNLADSLRAIGSFALDKHTSELDRIVRSRLKN